MFPRPGKDDTHYRPALAEAVYWTMTVATAVRAIAEIVSTLWPSSPLRLAIVAGGWGSSPEPHLRDEHVAAGAHAQRSDAALSFISRG